MLAHEALVDVVVNIIIKPVWDSPLTPFQELKQSFAIPYYYYSIQDSQIWESLLNLGGIYRLGLNFDLLSSISPSTA